jgi:hypothetical protein
MSAIEIPSWIFQEAPGAAVMLGSLAGSAEDNEHRERIRRLVSNAAEPAWRDTGLCSSKAYSAKQRQRLPEDALYTAQSILAYTAYVAPDIPAIGHLESDQAKSRLRNGGTLAADLANKIREITQRDDLIENFWQFYRRSQDDGRQFSASLSELPGTLDGLVDFLRWYEDKSRPAGPRISVVQQPQSELARNRTVIIRIGRICRNYFHQPMYGTVTILAGLTLNCSLNKRTVIDILRPYAPAHGVE